MKPPIAGSIPARSIQFFLNQPKNQMQIEPQELAQLIAAAQPQKTEGFAETNGHPTGQHIVVLDRGFVYVGDVTCTNQYVTITNAKNLRVWGTSNGLGELRNGPLSGTKLDTVGEVIAPHKAVIHFIPCKGF